MRCNFHTGDLGYCDCTKRKADNNILNGSSKSKKAIKYAHGVHFAVESIQIIETVLQEL